jgi:SAM-dependent methyltransferase
MRMTTSLQNFLEPGQLARPPDRLQQLFLEGGFNLKEEIWAAMAAADPNEAFVILDEGCGTGGAIEQLIRSLPPEAARRDFHQKIEGIGVDERPLSGRISQMVFWMNPERGQHTSMFDNPLMGFDSPSQRQLRSTLLQANVEHLPLKDESVNFGYSYATLIYVVDALKALEEGFRVLKPGGVMIFNVEDRWISKTPRFNEILDETPGAREAFTYQPSLEYENDGFVIIRKSEDSTFQGFPYYLVNYVAPAGTAVNRGEPPKERRDFNRAGIYKKYKKFLRILNDIS